MRSLVGRTWLLVLGFAVVATGCVPGYLVLFERTTDGDVVVHLPPCVADVVVEMSFSSLPADQEGVPSARTLLWTVQRTEADGVRLESVTFGVVPDGYEQVHPSGTSPPGPAPDDILLFSATVSVEGVVAGSVIPATLEPGGDAAVQASGGIVSVVPHDIAPFMQAECDRPIWPPVLREILAVVGVGVAVGGGVVIVGLVRRRWPDGPAARST